MPCPRNQVDGLIHAHHAVSARFGCVVLHCDEYDLDIDVLFRSAIDSGTVLNVRGRAKSVFGLLMEVRSRPSGSLRLEGIGEYVCIRQC